MTFDKILYIKTREICASLRDTPDFKNVNISIGRFHLSLFYLGCIPFRVQRIYKAGSALEQLLSQIYAPNTVEYMLASQAFARAMAHLRQKVIIEFRKRKNPVK